MKKPILLGTLLFAFVACEASEKDKNIQASANAKAKLPLVEASEASKTNFVHKISIQGNIESTQDILLNAEMSGQIKEVLIAAGDHVKMGQVLIEMDASIVAANIGELESQLEFAAYVLQKQNELFAQDLGSEFDKKNAENQVNSLTAKLKTLNIQKSKMVVLAPFDGTIDELFAKKGQLASPQMPLMRLVNTENTEVVASVSEKHFRNIKKGTELKVKFPNYNLSPILTKVSSVGSYIDPTNRTFNIRAKVVNEMGLMPNMLAELEITDFKIDSGMVVPSKSILKNAKSQDYLWVIQEQEDGKYKVEQVFIEKIKVYDGLALITDHERIKNRTLIIESGARGITKNDLVRIK